LKSLSECMSLEIEICIKYDVSLNFEFAGAVTERIHVNAGLVENR